jgi:cation diffusion facilitator family transporter
MSAPRADPLADLRHTHDLVRAVAAHEVRTRWVVALTFATMVAELVVGYATNSLALLADGWHMATHVGALGLAAFAYWFARRQAGSRLFSFGTGKVHALAGYTSAVVLALVALLMVVESLRRLLQPEPIAFTEALPVAVLGLAVNLISAKLLHDDEHDDHGNGERDHQHAHDHNLRAAYVHVLADALTSVLAIAALLGGHLLGWMFLDAAMGIVGGLVIARWSYGLCRQAGAQLLDVVPSPALAERIRERLETQFAGAHVVDLHLWDIGPGARACIVSLAAPEPLTPTACRAALAALTSLQHVTVEVHLLADPIAAPEVR